MYIFYCVYFTLFVSFIRSFFFSLVSLWLHTLLLPRLSSFAYSLLSLSEFLCVFFSFCCRLRCVFFSCVILFYNYCCCCRFVLNINLFWPMLLLLLLCRLCLAVFFPFALVFLLFCSFYVVLFLVFFSLSLIGPVQFKKIGFLWLSVYDSLEFLCYAVVTNQE